MQMMTRTCLSTLAVSMLPLFGSGMAAAQDADLQVQLEEVQQQYEEAVAAGDWETIGSMSAEDAIYMPSTGGVAEGRAAIQSQHEQDSLQAIDVRSDRTEMIGEDVVLDIGTWTARCPKRQAAGPSKGSTSSWPKPVRTASWAAALRPS